MDSRYERIRRYPRIAAEHAVLVRKVTPDGGEGFVKTQVVGLGGCMLLGDQEMGIGTSLELLISVDHRVVKARGEVVYERQADGMRVEIGVRFVDVETDDLAVIQGLFVFDAVE